MNYVEPNPQKQNAEVRYKGDRNRSKEGVAVSDLPDVRSKKPQTERLCRTLFHNNNEAIGYALRRPLGNLCIHVCDSCRSVAKTYDYYSGDQSHDDDTSREVASSFFFACY
jgi:hypothetical protein